MPSPPPSVTGVLSQAATRGAGVVAAPPFAELLQQFPEVPRGVNALDSLQQRQKQVDSWKALSMVSDNDDVHTYRQVLRGLANAAGINNPSTDQTIDQFSRNVAQLSPYLMQFAPDLWHKLHGSRGSAATLSKAISAARPDLPPEQAAAEASQIFRHLYSPLSKSSADGATQRNAIPLERLWAFRELLRAAAAGVPSPASPIKFINEKPEAVEKLLRLANMATAEDARREPV